MKNEEYLKSFIQKHGIRVKEEVKLDFIKLFLLEHGIFDYEDESAQSVIELNANGVIMYFSYTESGCKDIAWDEVERFFKHSSESKDEKKPLAPKYKLTDETIEWNGAILHRIECVTDCGDVKAGDKGGFIEKEDNLAQYGECWVGDNAYVCGNAKVIEDAMVLDNAMVFDNALICETSAVADNAIVSGNSRIMGDSRIYHNANVDGSVTLSDCLIGGVVHIGGDFAIDNGVAYETDILSKEEYEQYRTAINGLYPKHREKKITRWQLRAYLKRKKIQVVSENSCDFCTRFILEHCVFNPEHKAKDAAIFLYDDGNVVYKCLHNECSNKTWKDVIDLLGPICIVDEIGGIMEKTSDDNNPYS